MDKLLGYPLLVAVLGGVGVYIFQFVQRRSAICRAITTDIRSVLSIARKNAEYLERTDHYWLEPGRVLPTAPVAFRPRDELFSALLPELHVLGARNFARVLALYSYYRYCENLRRELFREIQGYRDRGEQISAELCNFWDVDRKRVADAYRILCRAYGENVSISCLRMNYDLPSAAAVEDAARLA